MKAKKNKRERSSQMRASWAQACETCWGWPNGGKSNRSATWVEIEAAVDERINQLRAQVIQDVVQMGETEQWSQKPEEERPSWRARMAPA